MPNLNNAEVAKAEQLKSFFEMWSRILGTLTISIEEYKSIFELYKSCVKEGNLSPELQSLFLIALFDTNVDLKNQDMNQVWEVINYRNELLDMGATLDESISR